MAPPGQPGSNSRGRGGKFRSFTRGGGKNFSRNLRPVDADGNEISMWSMDAQPKPVDDSSEQESEEESSSESDSDNGITQQTTTLTREERRQAAKARKEAAIAKKKAQAIEVGDLPPSDSEDEDDELANPNHSRAARNQTMAAAVEDVTTGVQNLSTAGNRKERESAEAQLAKERYQRLHEQGKTDEAKADLARLKLIREQREADAARRQAEKEEKLAQEEARRAAFEEREARKRAAALGKKGAKKSK
ncbi:hypothetical protein ACRALDRAFT_2113996 [Sodiomyces alcalophilus JCM 7366]|uniref:uncharacterized protein n=1 Tax=Sodiomyces alcalophilus JCM 7366 TaxID=591952 RepID=UPI0039B62E6C